MDAYDTVSAKVQAIFRELVGERAEVLKGTVNAIQANDILSLALAQDQDPLQADELAFHLIDWNADAAFIVALLLYPEHFTSEELAAGTDMFLIHVPAHILAAARLGGYEAVDFFDNENRTEPLKPH